MILQSTLLLKCVAYVFRIFWARFQSREQSKGLNRKQEKLDELEAQEEQENLIPQHNSSLISRKQRRGFVSKDNNLSQTQQEKKENKESEMNTNSGIRIKRKRTEDPLSTFGINPSYYFMLIT